MQRGLELEQLVRLPTKVINAVFYKTAAGNEPVREFLRGLSSADTKAIGGHILKVECTWPDVKKPLVDGLKGGLCEVRISIKDRIARIFFCVEKGQMVLLHGIIKKTQKTPQSDLELARKRMQDWKKQP